MKTYELAPHKKSNCFRVIETDGDGNREVIIEKVSKNNAQFIMGVLTLYRDHLYKTEIFSKKDIEVAKDKIEEAKIILGTELHPKDIS